MIRWLAPGASEETVVWIHAVVRKLAHVTEYAILGVLVVRALDVGVRSSVRLAAHAVLVCAAYAALDELHQAWVPSRTGSPLDVLLDLAGAVAGATWRARWGPLSAGRRSSA